MSGCIPSKALISITKLYERAKEGALPFGIVADGIRVDLPSLQRWKSGVVSTLETGIAALCRGNKIQVIRGEAELVSANTLQIKTGEGTEEVHTKNVVIATGSQAISLPGLEFDGKLVLQLDRCPRTREGASKPCSSSAAATSGSRSSASTRSWEARSPSSSSPTNSSPGRSQTWSGSSRGTSRRGAPGSTYGPKVVSRSRRTRGAAG